MPNIFLNVRFIWDESENPAWWAASVKVDAFSKALMEFINFLHKK